MTTETDTTVLDAYLDRIDAALDALATDPAVTPEQLAAAYMDLGNRIDAAGQALVGIREWNHAVDSGGVLR